MNKDKIRVNNTEVYERNMNFLNKVKNNVKKLDIKLNESASQKNDKNLVSSKIFSNKKIGLFKCIFRLLDSDLDGKISFLSYRNGIANNNFKSFIQPIIDDMIKNKKSFNESEFINECEVLYNVS